MWLEIDLITVAMLGLRQIICSGNTIEDQFFFVWFDGKMEILDGLVKYPKVQRDVESKGKTKMVLYEKNSFPT